MIGLVLIPIAYENEELAFTNKDTIAHKVIVFFAAITGTSYVWKFSTAKRKPYDKPIPNKDKLSYSELELKKNSKAHQIDLLSPKIENHKGTWCPYTFLFCQEGLCSGCQIYYERTR